MDGQLMCAVSVLMRFFPQESEVESKTTSRTRPDLAGKPKEDNSMARKRKSWKGWKARSASPVRMVKPALVEPKLPTVQVHTRRSIPEAATPSYASGIGGCATLSMVSDQ